MERGHTPMGADLTGAYSALLWLLARAAGSAVEVARDSEGIRLASPAWGSDSVVIEPDGSVHVGVKRRAREPDTELTDEQHRAHSEAAPADLSAPTGESDGRDDPLRELKKAPRFGR